MEKSYRRKVVYLGRKCKYAKVLHQKMKKNNHNFQAIARILTTSIVTVSAGTRSSWCLCWRIMSGCAVLVTASLAHVLVLIVANHNPSFNTTWLRHQAATLNDLVFTSTMEAVCIGCSKGMFLFGTYLGDSDVLFQFLKDHKLVTASESAQNVKVKLLSIIRGASTVNYSLPTSRTPSLLPQQSKQDLLGKKGFWVG